MANEFLYEKANKVLGYVPPDEDGVKEIGIEVIVMILQLLPIIYQCWKDHKKAVSRVRNPSFFDRLVLRRAVRQKLGSAHFRKYGKHVMDGVLALGVDATEEDVVRLLDSVSEK